MITYIFGQVLLLVAIMIVFWLPGRVWVAFLERKGRFLSALERIAVAVTLSVVTVTFVMILIGQVGIPLNAWSVLGGIAVISGGMFAWLRLRFLPTQKLSEKQYEKNTPSFAFFAVFILAILFKLFYFLPLVVPSSTDLGHHMFWVKKIIETGKLPVYEERDIEMGEDGRYVVGDPVPMSDFIVGEHLVFSAVGMISAREVTSAFPVTALFVLHLTSLVAVYALTRRFFARFSWGEKVAVVALFFYGVLYAVGGSQMKYVVGGAVGNVFGNLLIPMGILLATIALRTRRVEVLIASCAVMFGLIYTHHLSTLLLFVTLVGVLLAFVVLRRDVFSERIFPMMRDRRFWGVVVVFVGVFLIFPPSYIANRGVEEIVGAPVYEEHQGFTFAQLIGVVGDPRVAFGMLGMVFLMAKRSFRTILATSILFGWTFPFLVMTLFPGLIGISLPSARVANYLVAPISILSGVALVLLVAYLRHSRGVSKTVFSVAILLVMAVISYRGIADNAGQMKVKPLQQARALELFHAGAYFSQKIPSTEGVVMHDHINVPGNSFLKTFFLEDYNYPFYRAHLFRYDRPDNRQEKCTLYVVSTPDSDEAKKCQEELNVQGVLVDETIDGQQFQHFRNFDKVYADAFHGVYVRSDL